MKRTRVLVTGGAGFIGSNLVRRLVADGRKVTVIDDLSSGRMSNLEDVVRKIRFVKGSICDPATVNKALRGGDTVFHLAAIPSVPRSVKQPVEITRANVEGTVRLLESSVKAGVRRLVFASSSSVYGDTPTLPKHEGMPPNPLSPYASSKLAGEYYCRAFSRLYPLETVSLRFFNVFGPRQNPRSQYAAAIPIFIRSIAAGEPAPIFGDGKQTRDFTFVADVVDGLVKASIATGVNGGVFNLACGGRIRVDRLAIEIGRIMGRKTELRFLPRREGDILHSYADIDRARKLLKFRPRHTLAAGLIETVEWFLNNELS